jgi:hypothetical protein
MSLIKEIEAVLEKYSVNEDLLHVTEGIVRVADGGVYEEEGLHFENHSGHAMYLIGCEKPKFPSATIEKIEEFPKLNKMDGEQT